jgi:hypothetical protein
MAGKSVLAGAASKAYGTCHGPKCGRIATKAVALTSVSEKGSDVEVVPLCKDCHKTAQKNAQVRGLAAPRGVRLTKSVAQDMRDQDSPTKKAAPINPHKADRERLRGERQVSPIQPHLVGKAPESMARVNTIKINQLDQEHAFGLYPAIFDKSDDHPLFSAYNQRHHEVSGRKFTREKRENILSEALVGLRSGKYKDKGLKNGK